MWFERINKVHYIKLQGIDYIIKVKDLNELFINFVADLVLLFKKYMFELHVFKRLPCLVADEGPSSTEVSCADFVTLMSSLDVLKSHARHCTAVSCEDCRTLISSVEMVRGHMRHCENHRGKSCSLW